MRARVKAKQGFTLIESLAAFAILALTLSQLFSGMSLGARNEARADFLLRASRQGASQLETIGVDGPVPLGRSSGRYPDGLLWSLIVTPGKSVSGPAAPVAISFHATLTIKKPSGFGETFTLSAVKMAPVEPQH
jgi:general secretion pathway protein I